MTYRTTLTPTAKELQEFKKICEKESIKYDTEAEYQDAAQNLINFCGLLYDMAKEDWLRQKRLENEPGGFELEGEGRTCPLCKQSVYGGAKLWFDKWGMKCMDCQDALNKKVIPGYVFKDRENNRHVTASVLSWKFNIRHSTIKKLVRQGKLKPRIIPKNDVMVFLATENKDIVDIIEANRPARNEN